MRGFLKRCIWWIWTRGQRLGVDVLPRHFYTELPKVSDLARKRDWRPPRSTAALPGRDIEGQLTFLAEVAQAADAPWLATNQAHARACAATRHDGFGPVEAAVLHAFLRHTIPARIIQVGCGVSTAVLLDAADASATAPSITCIDPFPSDWLRQRATLGDLQLREQGAQELPIADFLSLQAGDLLFIDSSHVVGPGSEVNRLVLDVLPHLAPGVWVHFHDITLPYDYPRQALNGELFFHHESVLIQAFLAHNHDYEIGACLSWLHYANPGRLAAIFPLYQPQSNDEGLATSAGHFPSSLYIRRRDEAPSINSSAVAQ